MFKKIYINRNLALFDEIQKQICEMESVYTSDKAITDTVSLKDISEKFNPDYRLWLGSRSKWRQIREDEVLLTALRDELKRLRNESDYAAKVG